MEFTHSNRYSHVNSHSHPSKINSVLIILVHQSIQLTGSVKHSQEMETLKSVLAHNKYDPFEIKRALNKLLLGKFTAYIAELKEMLHNFLPYMKIVTHKSSNS